MLSKKQIEANRRNSKKSTGPKSSKGKAIVRNNSLKHGMLAKEIIITRGDGAEDSEEFERLTQSLLNHFNPVGIIEEILVEEMLVLYWRKKRAYRFEVGLIRKNLDCYIDGFFEHEDIFGNKLHKRPNLLEDEIGESDLWIDEHNRALKKLYHLKEKEMNIKTLFDADYWRSYWDNLEKKLMPTDDSTLNSLSPEDSGHRTPSQIYSSLKEKGIEDDEILCFIIESVELELAISLNKKWKSEKELRKTNFILEQIPKVAFLGNEHGIDLLIKYEGSITKQFYRALNELERLQRKRLGKKIIT